MKFQNVSYEISVGFRTYIFVHTFVHISFHTSLKGSINHTVTQQQTSELNPSLATASHNQPS